MDPRYENLGKTSFELGARGLCPRCGKGHIFDGFLTLARRCEVCGLDYSFADPADGPAFFAMSIVSFPLVGFAAWLELAFQAPIWVHLITTLPLLVISCMALLRPLKGWLVCSQYINKASEARLSSHRGIDPEDDGGGDR
ncbi:hypothetical protein N825_05745 [Skermanella stibiiresistens SB22]|uniref:DUF983 domain-containing protein n=1 Tax=Skermanella stibiiresistens SB22 TaxID=1385369 RepID=W9H489_9PROT|nr:DUF983 domain-containing protein [Skermanella stibiiresistens]EWY39591.1 hypothetical protein N825_05745 [Skermanella stibiiresistens SB22]